MHVFMTGGAGFIGSRIARLILARGDRVMILARDAATVVPPGAQTLVGDPADATLLENAAREADAVMYVALATEERASAIDREAVTTFGEALAASGKPLVHTSAAGIVGDTHGVAVDQTFLPNPAPSVRWRFDNERAARDLAHRGVRVTVVRPAPIVRDVEHPGFVVDAIREAACHHARARHAKPKQSEDRRLRDLRFGDAASLRPSKSYVIVRNLPISKEIEIASTTLTSKGQMTLPKEIRDRMKLKTGDRLDVSTDGDRIVMTPSTLDIDDLCNVLPPPKRIATIDDIDSAIRQRAVRGHH